MSSHKINIEDFSNETILYNTIASSSKFGDKKLIACVEIDLRKIYQTVIFEVWHKKELIYSSSDIEKAVNHYNNI